MSYIVIVTALPNITMQPASTTFKVGDINVIAMSCNAVGETPLYFQWEKYYLLDNSWIRPSERAVNFTSHLKFKLITEDDEGIYRCIVTSDDGSVVSDNATIYVYGEYTLYVTGFWKTDQIVTLGLFHFIGPANHHTCILHIHSAITRLGGLVCFSRASFVNPVNL